MDLLTTNQFDHSHERSLLPAAHDAGGADRLPMRLTHAHAGSPLFAHVDLSQAAFSKAPIITGQAGSQTFNCGRRWLRKKKRGKLRPPPEDHIGPRKTEGDFDRASRVENIAAALYSVPPQFLDDPLGVYLTVGCLAVRLQVVDRREWFLFVRELNLAAEFYRANYSAHLPPAHRRWARIKRLPAYMSAVESQSPEGNRHELPRQTRTRSMSKCDPSAENLCPETGKSGVYKSIPCMKES